MISKKSQEESAMLQIAICDDEQFYREKLLSIVKQYLEQRNLAYTVQLYPSGEQFLAQYENNVKYDIVLWISA